MPKHIGFRVTKHYFVGPRVFTGRKVSNISVRVHRAFSGRGCEMVGSLADLIRWGRMTTDDGSSIVPVDAGGTHKFIGALTLRAAPSGDWFARYRHMGRVLLDGAHAPPAYWEEVARGKELTITELPGLCLNLYLMPEGDFLDVCGEGRTGDEVFRSRFLLDDYRELIAGLRA